MKLISTTILDFLNENKNITYGTYILTAFETEIEHTFNTKKEMLDYLSKELWG